MTTKEEKLFIKTLKRIGMDDDEIESRLDELKNLEGWEPITYGELLDMSDEDKSKLKSYCWKDGRYRCDCIGITDVVFELKDGKVDELRFSDETGDPHIYGPYEMSTQIYKAVYDGHWTYALFKKK